MGKKRSKACPTDLTPDSTLLAQNKLKTLQICPKMSVLEQENVKKLSERAFEAAEKADCETMAELMKKSADLENTIKKIEQSLKNLAVDLAIWKGEVASSAGRRDKLEELCRMLQAQTRSASEDTKNSISSDEERSQKLREEFEDAVSDVKKRLTLQKKQCELQAVENHLLSEKLSAYASQWQIRQEYRAQKYKGKDMQIESAKKLYEEKESALKEYKMKYKNLLEQVKNQKMKNEALREQTKLYMEKVKDYEGTLANNAALWPDLEKRCNEMKALAQSKENKEHEEESGKIRNILEKTKEMRRIRLEQIQDYRHINTQLKSMARSLQTQRDLNQKKIKALEEKILQEKRKKFEKIKSNELDVREECLRTSGKNKERVEDTERKFSAAAIAMATQAELAQRLRQKQKRRAKTNSNNV
mmetsp:Transcript_13708/g.20385  ORF Transcript_13708/g.20385 Transcript_13708/m.20385 type:complete len:417 (-) Transcript_13708:16-1266(-)